METCIEPISIIERPEAGSHKTERPVYSTATGTSKISFPIRSLLIIKTIVEYGFGVYVGFICGWIVGLWVGNSYVRYSKPAYIQDISEFSYWQLLPYDFAKNCSIIGVIFGFIAIKIVNNKLLKKRIISLYKKGNTEPKDIAQNLWIREQRIKRLIDNLTEKGKIDCEKEICLEERQS